MSPKKSEAAAACSAATSCARASVASTSRPLILAATAGDRCSRHGGASGLRTEGMDLLRHELVWRRRRREAAVATLAAPGVAARDCARSQSSLTCFLTCKWLEGREGSAESQVAGRRRDCALQELNSSRNERRWDEDR